LAAVVVHFYFFSSFWSYWPERAKWERKLRWPKGREGLLGDSLALILTQKKQQLFLIENDLFHFYELLH